MQSNNNQSINQVKIMKNPDLLHTASEQFLGKKEHEIKSTVLQTLEGHLRAILGTWENIYVKKIMNVNIQEYIQRIQENS